MNSICFVMEDPKNVRQQVSYILNKRGFKIDQYTSVEQVHKEIDPKNPPDIMVLDYDLKENACEKLLQELRDTVPVIICVAGTEAFERNEDVTRLYKLGATDVKPKDNPSLLYRALDTILKRKRKSDTSIIKKELNYGGNV